MSKQKNKNTKHNRPFHLHVEYFFRERTLLLTAMALFLVAIAQSDGKAMGIMRDAYAEGFGMIGQYLREETARDPASIDIGTRMPTISGQ
jgi:hypothetical protein